MDLNITERITLTETRPEDRDDVFNHLQERDVSRYTLRIPYPYAREHADGWLTQLHEAAESGVAQTLWSIRDPSGMMIGAIELAPFESPQEHTAEVGYWLAKPYWGQGIMTAVVKFMVARAFRETPIVRIVAPIFAVNVGSARVLEKAGFVVEAALLRKAYLRDGQYFDGRLYACVREDSQIT